MITAKMRIHLHLKSFFKYILNAYISLKVVFLDYSNGLEILFSGLMFLIIIAELLHKRRIEIQYAKIICGCLFLSGWILMSIISKQSAGNPGPLFMQIEFLLCIINFISIHELFDNSEKRKVYKVIFFLTAISLTYNVFMNILHPEYRINLYLNNNISGRFIGGVTYSFYVSLFIIVILYNLLYVDRNNALLKMGVIALGIYYIISFSPSATVIILLVIASVVSIVLGWADRKCWTKTKRIIAFTLLALLPLALCILLNIIYSKMSSESRLYARFGSIIEVIKTPGIMLSNTYFYRFKMMLNEIKLTFSSLKIMLIGIGYNFGYYTTVTEQMDSLGIGYHSSMIDWFPTFGLISGSILWSTLYRIHAYLNYKDRALIPKIIWWIFILYCFLNSGFNSSLLIIVLLFSVFGNNLYKE